MIATQHARQGGSSYTIGSIEAPVGMAGKLPSSMTSVISVASDTTDDPQPISAGPTQHFRSCGMRWLSQPPACFHKDDGYFRGFEGRHRYYRPEELWGAGRLGHLRPCGRVQAWEIPPVHDFLIGCATRAAEPTGVAVDRDVLLVGPCGTRIGTASLRRLVDPAGRLDDNIVSSGLAAIAAIQTEGSNLLAPAADGRIMTVDTWFGNRVMDGTAGDEGIAAADANKTPLDLATVYSVTIPIHYGGDHWVLVYCNFKAKQARLLDSLRSDEAEASILPGVSSWLAKLLGGCDGWTVARLDVPQQPNTHDCGVHVLLNALCMTLDTNPIDSGVDPRALAPVRLFFAGILYWGGFRQYYLARHGPGAPIPAEVGGGGFLSQLART